MFEHIFVPVVSAAEDVGGPVDFGQLVETMLFYDRVSFAVHGPVLPALLQTWGADGLLTLVEEQFLTLVAVEKQSLVFTQNQGTTIETHAPALASIRTKSGNLIRMLEANLSTEAFTPYCRSANEARKIAVNIRRLSDSYSLDDAVVDRMAGDFRDAEYMRNSALAILHEVAPRYTPPPNFVFALSEVEDKKFRVRTNIDFAAAAAAYAAAPPRSHQALTTSTLLATIAGARETLEAAALFDAEVSTRQLTSGLMQERISAAVKRRFESAEQINLFARLTLDHGNAISEAVNSGEKTFADIIGLLHKAREFRSWLRSAPPNAELMGHYYSTLRSGSWIEQLPAKPFRWAVFAGLGVVSPLLGFGASLVDSFLLDKMIKGWKPSQFVDDSLRQFVATPLR